MRTIEEIKKEQDEAIFKLGAHTALAEQFKNKVLQLAIEADASNSMPRPEEPVDEPSGDYNPAKYMHR